MALSHLGHGTVSLVRICWLIVYCYRYRLFVCVECFLWFFIVVLYFWFWILVLLDLGFFWVVFFRGKSVCSWCDRSSDRPFMVDTLSYFSFQPVFHDWYNKGRGMCYSVCGMMHIKESLMLIGKSSPCGGSGLPISAICVIVYHITVNITC